MFIRDDETGAWSGTFVITHRQLLAPPARVVGVGECVRVIIDAHQPVARVEGVAGDQAAGAFPDQVVALIVVVAGSRNYSIGPRDLCQQAHRALAERHLFAAIGRQRQAIQYRFKLISLLLAKEKQVNLISIENYYLSFFLALLLYFFLLVLISNSTILRVKVKYKNATCSSEYETPGLGCSSHLLSMLSSSELCTAINSSSSSSLAPFTRANRSASSGIPHFSTNVAATLNSIGTFERLNLTMPIPLKSNPFIAPELV